MKSTVEFTEGMLSLIVKEKLMSRGYTNITGVWFDKRWVGDGPSSHQEFYAKAAVEDGK